MVATKIENTNLRTIESVLGIVARFIKMLSCIVSPNLFNPIIPTVIVMPAQTNDWTEAPTSKNDFILLCRIEV